MVEITSQCLSVNIKIVDYERRLINSSFGYEGGLDWHWFIPCAAQERGTGTGNTRNPTVRHFMIVQHFGNPE